ncbi:MAG: hypothetical protein GWO41_15705 [candidate division Zixibacteria bacterium]|nr:hypothetical protein [candidate division Zixibacteria bacterium]NIR68141.1 hypothetical protein [candidate division Zixibacteria bacterium]NIS17817.1 hypothetical protein [candidate division Zixibacteria bacterium]NIS49356.1 hypothetical protein [candidate division Zixibacteria bacterium]NIT54135.1 hypothetical protein [candidate division Zixibacteria bacterium]
MNKNEDKIEILLKFLRGELNAKESKKVRSLIKEDRDMAELLAVLKNLQPDGRHADWKKIFKSALELSSRQFEDFQKSQHRNQPPYGITVYDSSVLPIPTGIRSEFSSTVNSRRLKYKIDGMELVLSLQPVSMENFNLMGQISGLDEGLKIRVLLISGRKRHETGTDQFYVFHFERIPTAEYSIKIYEGNRVIGIADFKI